MIACRNEPVPESLVFKTLNVAAEPAIGNKNSCADDTKHSRPSARLMNFALTTALSLPEKDHHAS
jgi:hypothetical protein